MLQSEFSIHSWELAIFIITNATVEAAFALGLLRIAVLVYSFLSNINVAM